MSIVIIDNHHKIIDSQHKKTEHLFGKENLKSRYLEKAELLKLATLLGAGWLPYAVQLETGLRIGDVCSLKWSNLNRTEIALIASKTGKPFVGELSTGLVEALEATGTKKTSEYVFPGRDPGTHITRQALWLRLKTAAERAGIDLDGVSPHSMRKVYAVDVAHERGLKAAQEGLQHTHLSDTEIYALSDWTSGENAELPMLRRDVTRVVDEIIDLFELR